MTTETAGGEARGTHLLMRISNEMVQAKKKYFGKGPVKAKSYFFDDLLLVVMRGGLTTAEKTMLDFGQEEKVQEFRQVFENEMTGPLTALVEDLTGRKVVNYQSQIMFDPDVVIEMFVFDERVEEGAEATAEGQLGEGPTGEVEGDEPSPPPGAAG